MKGRVEILDSTLRDGAQAGGISFSVEDKLKIAQALDEFGVDFIEAGNPGSNAKDLEFFDRAGKELRLRRGKLVAFGSTRRPGVKAEDDLNLRALLSAGTDTVAVFGKAWNLHVTEILKVSLEENLEIIDDTVRFLVKNDREVIFDAEHFFDGYAENEEYALLTVKAALEAGARRICLCDTRGGLLAKFAAECCERVTLEFRGKIAHFILGIHCHNDVGMATASSVAAVCDGGVTHIQGTFLGFGERAGNACLAEVIPNLQILSGFECVPSEKLAKLSQTAKYIAEVSNVSIGERAPFIGKYAFTHKAGMHIDGVKKSPESFEYINPREIGRSRHLLVSEVAGRSAVIDNVREFVPEIDKNDEKVIRIVEKVKAMEFDGYQLEAAEASLELLIRKELGIFAPSFDVLNFKIIGEQYAAGSSAMIKISVAGEEEITAAEGNGPVNALNNALKKALSVFFPVVADVKLVDYKVRVLDSDKGTAAKVRVLIESADGVRSWTTVGVSADIIEASWIALVDALEYKLIME